MKDRTESWESAEWDLIAKEVGGGFSARQVMDRWFYYLRPGISREAFTMEERRQALKLSVTGFGNWARIAAQVGDGQRRSCAQIKSAVAAMYGKLNRLGIKLQTPEDVDALPDEFFAKIIPGSQIQKIRNQFFVRRIEELRKKLEEEKKKEEEKKEKKK
jgi:hypothetical protein